MAREPDVALFMAAFVKKYVKKMLKNVNNMALSAKNWLSQPKRFPTPDIDCSVFFSFFSTPFKSVGTK